MGQGRSVVATRVRGGTWVALHEDGWTISNPARRSQPCAIDWKRNPYTWFHVSARRLVWQ